jgi:NitT/TauT family transport system ATP-binding protein
MSNRPGRIVKKCSVTLPRPRDLDVTYSQEFQDVVHDLRSMIGGQH